MGPRRAALLALMLGVALGCSDEAPGLDGDGAAAPGAGEAPAGGTGGSGSPGDPDGSGSGGAPGSGSAPPAIHPTCPGESGDAFGELPVLPTTVQAEDFDPAGYSDSSETNEGAAYRPGEAVDVKETAGGYAVGWMTSGEWLEFTVEVPVEGDYALTLQAGSADPGRTLALSSCGTDLSGQIPVAEVADWGQFAATAPVTVHLLAGVQVLRLTVGASDYVDLDSFTFTLIEEGPGSGGSGGSDGSGGTGGTGGSDGSGGSGPGTHVKFVGNITTDWSAALDYAGLTYSDHWDQVTPENAGKWGSVQGTADSAMNFNTLDAIYDYAEDKGILFKQHVFVWGAQQPSGNITEAHVKAWMNAFCDRYPNTKIADVVNEPPPHTTPEYDDAIGGGTDAGTWEWITNSFKWAREACPNTILVLNDYNNIEWSGQTDHFIDIAKKVLAAGGPIDALGAQAHGLSTTSTTGAGSTAEMKRLLQKMHDDTGLPVYITEYDISQASDATQAARFKEHIPYFLEQDWIPGITIWGWIVDKTWVANTGLVQQNGTPREAMTWLMNELDRPVPGQ